jgi:hypothetical protein
MEQLAAVAWSLLTVVTVLVALGVAATTFGSDSRPCVGDSHTDARRSDWI